MEGRCGTAKTTTNISFDPIYYKMVGKRLYIWKDTYWEPCLADSARLLFPWLKDELKAFAGKDIKEITEAELMLELL